MLLHGCIRLGAALVPLNTRLAPPELQAQRQGCGAEVVVEEPLRGPVVAFEPRGAMAESEPVLVVHTSGTSGVPRAVELTAGNLAASAAASAQVLGVDPGDRWLCVLPLFHVGGLSILTRSVIGATTALVSDRFEPYATRAALEEEGITLASLVPTQLRRLRDAGLREAPGLRAILLGGGPIPSDLLEWARAAQLAVSPTYGMTETCSQMATVPPAEALAGIRAARPLPGVDLRIAPDGEILVRGPIVAPGAVADDGWLHTGDLGELDVQGRVSLTGRAKDLIVTGGENVMPGEIEEALLAHPAVADAGVAGISDPEWGERVVAFVVLSAPATADELIAHCRTLVAGFKVPKQIHPLTELPRNAAGKLLRTSLRPQ